MMPCFFLAHGNPMNALQDNAFVRDWKTLHQGTPTPSAIVVFSAHWHVAGTRISSQTKPPTIHDFGGFPPALYQVQYPCAGAPALAQTLVRHLQQHNIAAQLDDSWGLDHGTWSILKHLYPKANIPVLQISLDNQQHDLKQHIAIGKALRPFRQQGVLFIGSGNIVHNIPKWFSYQPGDSIAWAKTFDSRIAEAITQRDIATLANYQTLPFAREAVPTIEHYLPLLYIIGLSNESDTLTFSHFAEEDLASACSRSVKFAPVA